MQFKNREQWIKSDYCMPIDVFTLTFGSTDYVHLIKKFPFPMKNANVILFTVFDRLTNITFKHVTENVLS
jgi:hypothetical protein